MKNYGVVFDVDDTLYDMSLPFVGAYRALYGDRHRLPMNDLFLAFRRYSDERFADSQTGKMTMEDLYIYRLRMALRAYGIEVTDEDALEFQRVYMGLQYRIKLTDTMEALLNALQNRAVIGIITNGDSAHQRRKIDALGIARWVSKEHTIVSGDHAFRKPDVRIFREMERRIGLGPEQMIYVGDAFGLDIIGADGAGWRSIWFNHRRRSKPDDTGAMRGIEVHTEEELSAALLDCVKKGSMINVTETL